MQPGRHWLRLPGMAILSPHPQEEVPDMSNARLIVTLSLSLLLLSGCRTLAPERLLTMPDGAQLFVEMTRGSRAGTVIYLHGGPGGSIVDGGYELQELLPERNWVMYDQRGGGRSTRVEGTITAAQHVEDLEELRRQLRIDRFALVGLSWGSGLAAMYAAKYPQHVERIVFLSPMPVAKTPFDAERRAATSKYWEEHAARRDELTARMKNATGAELVQLCKERFALGIYRAYVHRPESLQRARRCDRPEQGGLARNNTIESLGDWDYRPLLRSLTMPALVIEGAQSVVPLSSAREWAKTLPKGRLLLIDEAGHANWLDQPDVFREKVGAFLDGNTSAR